MSQAKLASAKEGASVLVCEDEPGLREMLGVLLRRAGYKAELFPGVRTALLRLQNGSAPDAVVTDLMMPDGSGMEVLRKAREKDPSTQVLMVTAFATTEQAVEAMRKGAYDYIQKPFKNHELLATLEKALEKVSILRENRALRAEVEAVRGSSDILGKSAPMRRVLDLIARIANAPTSVLVTGESGTGKEMVARAIHKTGSRSSKPFLAVNCGALPENLMESELFGHEKGAFTGASSPKEGLFRAASGGTIFLDEIGELSMRLQVKLLRVLQERKVRPVGATAEIPVDVRVLAATNLDLETQVQEGNFRQDLFYRLNVIHLELPALRKRREDIAILASFFVEKHAAQQGKTLTIEAEALRFLEAQDFPGNVRELENMVERAVTLSIGERITVDDFTLGGSKEIPSLVPIQMPSEGMDLDDYLARVEKAVLIQSLEQAGGVRTAAAKSLGMTFRSYRYRLAKYGLGDPND